MKRAVLVVLMIALLSCAKRKKGPTYQTTMLSAQGSAVCSIMKDGALRCWGSAGDEFPSVRAPKASFACASDRFVCADTRCTGNNVSFDLPDVHAISCEHDRACGLTATGVRCKTTTGEEVSYEVAGARAIASGNDATCVVLEDGTARCLGSNADGKLGDGTIEARTGLVTPKIKDVTSISIGEHHACALHQNETISCWGRNNHGQLGDGTFTDRFTPEIVSGSSGIGMVSAGGDHTCAHRKDDTIRCWGSDSHHQLGLGGSAKDMIVPALVPGLYEATAVACGTAFTCARMADGWIRCWGANESGQIGDGTRLEREVPMPVRF